jgi:type IV pilus assembly protein PilV
MIFPRMKLAMILTIARRRNMRSAKHLLPRNAKGVSLVEVLISLVLLAIGLLGTASLMSASLKNTNTAYYRSQATFLADDILDRMRANAAVASQYAINDSAITSATPPNSMAAFDCNELIATLAAEIPGGIGTVRITGDVVTVEISWDANESSFTTQTQL